jgi:hypothetical protein
MYGVYDTTQTELFEGYDRTGGRREKQIRSGMLLSILEARDRWYELKTTAGGRQDSVTRGLFQKER